jgi:hypothetical protein
MILKITELFYYVLRFSVTVLLVPGVLFFATEAKASDGLKLNVHGAPPKFYDYLLKHDEAVGRFDRSGQWALGRQADVIVIFARNAEDIEFVPAVLVSTFQQVVPMESSYLYFIPQRIFGESLDSDVLFILYDNLIERLETHDVVLPETNRNRNRFLSCMAAGMVNRNFDGVALKNEDVEIAQVCRAPSVS